MSSAADDVIEGEELFEGEEAGYEQLAAAMEADAGLDGHEAAELNERLPDAGPQEEDALPQTSSGSGQMGSSNEGATNSAAAHSKPTAPSSCARRCGTSL